ncbi:MAG: BatD family protein [Pseudomonadales bacterium]|nr:BatD family protein [Pseudomonadales bacterium]
MIKLIRILVLIPLTFLYGLTAAQEQNIEVSVDRNELARGETLTYTIRVYDQRQGMQLDLTPLTEEFDVLGTRTSSQIRSINGSVESWTDYIVTLFPLAEGELTIPSLEINDALTDPVAINVINEGPRSNQSNEELFLEIVVNKETIYVQEQLLFTVRLYYTINGIRNPQFTELEMADTVIQLIGSPNQYEKLIDGVRYGVYEKRYVIFPQRSGPLEIPDILFRGEVTDGSSNFVFRNLNTRRVTAFIEGITIQVAERPEAARNNQFWLPVGNLTLEENWNIDLSNLKVGDSAIRTITMVADGLDGAVLPPFSPVEIQNLNLYPDPPDIQRTFVDGRIVGTRVESTTLVPVIAGSIEIPEVSIPWWNINTDQQERTVIAATFINVATIEGEVPSEQTVISTVNIEELLEAAPVIDQSMIDAQAEAQFIEVRAVWLNWLIALAFLIVMISIYSLLLAPNKHAIRAFFDTQLANLIKKYSPENNEWVAYRQLVIACRKQDLIRIRESLIQWSNHFLDTRTLLTMEDILEQTESIELHEHATQIQAALFSIGSKQHAELSFDSHELIKLTTSLRKNKRKEQKRFKQEKRFALPPLYKT